MDTPSGTCRAPRLAVSSREMTGHSRTFLWSPRECQRSPVGTAVAALRWRAWARGASPPAGCPAAAVRELSCRVSQGSRVECEGGQRSGFRDICASEVSRSGSEGNDRETPSRKRRGGRGSQGNVRLSGAGGRARTGTRSRLAGGWLRCAPGARQDARTARPPRRVPHGPSLRAGRSQCHSSCYISAVTVGHPADTHDKHNFPLLGRSLNLPLSMNALVIP